MQNFSRRNWLAMAGVTSMALAGRATLGDPSEAGMVADQIGAPPLRPFARNVLEFGASGEGKTDDTSAFQKALDAVYASEGGIVHVPAGRYLIAGVLQVPPYTAIEGVFRGPTSHTTLGKAKHAANTRQAAGSVLMATGGRGDEDAKPLISMSENSAVLGLCIFHPKQNRHSTPVAYPWTISMNGNNCTVENVELLNSWRGIQAVRAHRHLIRNVSGQPLKTGIFVDEVYDIGRIENVHFNPWWSGIRPLLEFIYRQGESFVFGRTDWEYVLNTFSFGYHAGYRFIEGKTGSCNGNFVGIGADASWHACVIEHAQEPGLLITNGEFVSFDYLHLGEAVDSVQVLVKEGIHQGAWNRGPVRFVNCSFWGPCRQIARLESDTTLGFGDCTFCQWDKAHPAITAIAGNLLVNGCEFRQDGEQIRLGPKVQRAAICGNLSQGQGRIVIDAKDDNIQIGLNSGMQWE